MCFKSVLPLSFVYSLCLEWFIELHCCSVKSLEFLFSLYLCMSLCAPFADNNDQLVSSRTQLLFPLPVLGVLACPWQPFIRTLKITYNFNCVDINTALASKEL